MKEKLKGYGWWSNDDCFSCGYDLKTDPEKRITSGEWYQQTGCPKCRRSFVA